MDGQNESVILDVKLDAGKVAADLENVTREITNLRVSQKLLDKDLKEGNISFAEYDKQTVQIKDNLSWLQKEQKGLIATTKLLTADTNTYSDSLNGQRQKLADMQKAYDQLDKAQRESEGGKQFMKAIKAQHDAVLGLEMETGRAGRNVGNYTQSILDASQKMGGFGKATTAIINPVKNATLGLKAMSATPIIAILNILVTILVKLAEKFKGNAAAMEKLNSLFGAFSGIATIVDKIVDALAKGVGWLADKLLELADNFGLITEEMKASQQIAQDELALQGKARDAAKQTAEDNAKIAELRAKANEKDKAGTAERLRLLQEASDMEEAIAKRNADLAREAYELQKAKNAQSESSQEDLNKENELYIRMIETQTAYFGKQKELAGQMSALRKQQAAERAQAAKRREDELKAQAKSERDIQQQAEDFALSLIEDETAKAIAARRIQGEREIAALRERLETDKTLTAAAKDQLAQLIMAKEVQLEDALAQMAEDAAAKRTEAEYAAEQERAARILEYKLQLAQEGSDTELELRQAQLDLQLEQALAAENLTEEEKYLIRETFAKKAMELDQQYHDNLIKTAEDARKQYKQSLMQTAQNASSAFSAMSDLLAQYGEENEDAAAASRAFGIASIVTDQAISIANTAKAITEAVAGATQAAAAGGPAAPFLIGAYIAGMVGAVLGAVVSVASSIQQAKGLMSQADSKKSAGKYAGGGVVPGTSYTGDKLTANVNSAEVISNPRQAANLLYEISNNPARGGFDYEQMAAAVAAANAALPAPVLNYSEFEDFNQKRVTYNEIASL